MKRVFKKPNIYWAIGIFLLYVIMNLVISGFYKNINLIIIYAKNVNWIELLVSISFSLIIGFLVALNAIYGYIRYKERRECRDGIVTAGIGTIGGLVTGFCPLCIAGVFPLIFGLFGLTFSFASLPFKGIEVQILSIIILLVSLKMLNK